MFDIQLLVLKIVQNLGERHNARIETVFSIKITRNVVLSLKDSPRTRSGPNRPAAAIGGMLFWDFFGPLACCFGVFWQLKLVDGRLRNHPDFLR